MNANDLIKLVVGVIVGALMLSAILTPMIHASTDETITIKNEGAYFTTPDENEHTLLINATEITYDGEPCIYPDMELYGSATVLVGNDWFLRISKSTNPANSIEYVIAGPPQQYTRIGNSITDGECVITINGTGITAVCGSTTATRTGVEYIIADQGEWVLSHDPYVLANTPFVAAIRNISAIDIMEIVRGTINTPAEYETTMCRTWHFSELKTGTLTDSEFTVSLADADGDLKKLNEITQTATVNFEGVGDITRTITIDYILVPETITYDNPDYVGDNIAQILGVIPILVTVGLILGVVGVAFSRRE